MFWALVNGVVFLGISGGRTSEFLSPLSKLISNILVLVPSHSLTLFCLCLSLTAMFMYTSKE